MRKRDLLRRIEELERQVAELQARPVTTITTVPYFSSLPKPDPAPLPLSPTITWCEGVYNPDETGWHCYASGPFRGIIET